MVKYCKVCGEKVKDRSLTQWIIDKPFKDSKTVYYFHEDCLSEVTINGLN